jgi:hypothetical protein
LDPWSCVTAGVCDDRSQNGQHKRHEPANEQKDTCNQFEENAPERAFSSMTGAVRPVQAARLGRLPFTDLSVRK